MQVAEDPYKSQTAFCMHSTLWLLRLRRSADVAGLLLLLHAPISCMLVSTTLAVQLWSKTKIVTVL
jgi:hypothetical protein